MNDGQIAFAGLSYKWGGIIISIYLSKSKAALHFLDFE